jgi:hypothetical protein
VKGVNRQVEQACNFGLLYLSKLDPTILKNTYGRTIATTNNIFPASKNPVQKLKKQCTTQKKNLHLPKYCTMRNSGIFSKPQEALSAHFFSPDAFNPLQIDRN